MIIVIVFSERLVLHLPAALSYDNQAGNIGSGIIIVTKILSVWTTLTAPIQSQHLPLHHYVSIHH